MRFLTYGDKEKRTLMLIHGMANTSDLFDPLLPYRDYHNPVVFWHGENEPYPVKSAKLLKKYLPQMKKRVFKGRGHGQMLHEHTEAYAKRLIAFMEG